MTLFRLIAGAAVGLTATALMFASAQAAPVYSFEADAPNGGSISWSGNANDGIVGDDLPIVQIQFNNGPFGACTSCTLNFTTGDFDQKVGNTTFFLGGGSFEIFGDFGNGPELLAAGDVGASHWTDTPSGLDGTLSILSGATVSEFVQAHFGEIPILQAIFQGFVAVSFATSQTSQGFQSAPNGIAAVDAHLTVPEPASLGLLGVGLLGLGVAARRRRAA